MERQALERQEALPLLQRGRLNGVIMKKNYNFDFTALKSEKQIAKGMALNKPISTKYATELCREINGKNVSKAETFLNNIVAKKEFLPLRKYNIQVAHRKGAAKSNVKSGRYPRNTALVFLDLLQDVKANADYKGLDADKLFVLHSFASMGFRRFSHQPKGHIGGKSRRKKSTHVEIIVRERK